MAQSTNNLLDNKGIRIKKDAFVVLVRTEWNPEINDALENGVIEVLQSHHVAYKVVTVPGAVEIPFAIAHYWKNKKGGKNKPTAFIALGCVIKGDTPHFDYVCQSVTQGVTLLNVKLPVPVIFGVLTVLSPEQAYERLGGIHGHKGKEAAMAALKMMSL